MKKFLFLLVTFLCLVSTASAEIIERQRHKDWESFILTFEDGVCARMTTFVEPSIFVVDIFPKSERYPYGMYQVKIIEPQTDEQKANWEMVLPLSLGGKMRVDSRSIYDVRFDFSMTNNVLFINLGGEFGQTLVDEAKRGRSLFLRINPVRKEGNPVLLKFSLMGFTAAYNRCMSLIPLLERMSAPVPAPAPKKDPFADFGKIPAPQKTEPVAPPAPAPQYDNVPRPEFRDANVVFM